MNRDQRLAPLLAECDKCYGAGEEVDYSRSGFDRVSLKSCQACHGLGVVPVRGSIEWRCMYDKAVDCRDLFGVPDTTWADHRDCGWVLVVPIGRTT